MIKPFLFMEGFGSSMPCIFSGTPQTLFTWDDKLLKHVHFFDSLEDFARDAAEIVKREQSRDERWRIFPGILIDDTPVQTIAAGVAVVARESLAALTPIEKVAYVCHETNRALCNIFGDLSQSAWFEAEDWQRESAIKGVQFRLDHPDATSAAQHEAWMEAKLADGWVFGPVKDAEKKEHPCLIPYAELPFDQQVKDTLFVSIVRALIPDERPAVPPAPPLAEIQLAELEAEINRRNRAAFLAVLGDPTPELIARYVELIEAKLGEPLKLRDLLNWRIIRENEDWGFSRGIGFELRIGDHIVRQGVRVHGDDEMKFMAALAVYFWNPDDRIVLDDANLSESLLPMWNHEDGSVSVMDKDGKPLVSPGIPNVPAIPTGTPPVTGESPATPMTDSAAAQTLSKSARRKAAKAPKAAKAAAAAAKAKGDANPPD